VKDVKKEKDIDVEIIYTGNLSFEEQLERVKTVNGIFVDIAANYHIEKIKNKKKE